jgi:tRNA A-37 threonylcarbamoyl transferase component Bud32
MLGVYGERRTEEAVGRYRIVSQLGQGGTADVYLAVADGPAGFQKLVVLKVLRKSLAGDPEFRAMFLSEARLAARLHHPNIVQTNEVLELDGVPVMVMEYLEGQPLSQVIVRGREAGFSLAMQLRVLVDALHGLHAAHELADFDGTPLGVVHRDVSPHNLFVTLAGEAKVLDFGIAKLERSLVETEVGTIKGKLRYMAPEQVAGERVDRRADVYAAGVILWEALVGERMWKGCNETEIRSRVRQGDLQMPLALRAGVPPALDRICRRALSLSPADRHATALELADDLEAALPELGAVASPREIGATVARLFEDVRAETKGAIGRASKTHAVVDESAAEPPAIPGPAARPAARGRALWVTGAAALALGIAAVIAWWVGGGARLSVPEPSFGARPPGLGTAGAPAPAGSAVLPAGSAAARPADSATARPADHGPAAPVDRAAAVEPATGDARRIDPRGSSASRLLPKHPQRLAAPASAAQSAPPAAATDCDHPFFFDANGIKKFRPECM